MKPNISHSCFNCIHFYVCIKNDAIKNVAWGFWMRSGGPGTVGLHKKLAAVIGEYCADWRRVEPAASAPAAGAVE